MRSRTDKTQHFLCTNFNVPLKRYAADRAGLPVLTDDWLRHRFLLFETFCLPSVTGQTSLDFVWLVRCADSTPPEYRDRLARCRDAVDLRLVPERDSFHDAVRAALQPETERVLTTRLDNDDSLRRDVMEVVRDAATGSGPEFLNFPRGYVVRFPHGDVRLVKDPSNPFLSLLEPIRAEKLLTVFCTSHNRVGEIAPVRQLRRKPSWLQVVHERNLENRGTGRWRKRVPLEREFNVRPRAEWAETDLTLERS